MRMSKDQFIPIQYTLNVKGKLLDLSTTRVMGILNLTPDSFFSESRVAGIGELLAKAEKMLSEGADILDLGAMSSRPGSEVIEAGLEQERLLPGLHELTREFPEAIISVDTIWAATAEAAINSGAAIVNDISGGDFDEKMLPTVSKLGVPYIIMHMKGLPANMQKNLNEGAITEKVIFDLVVKLKKCREHGINDVIADPGFGFGKTVTQNYELLKHLDLFEKILKVPVLAGLSRKSMLNKIIGSTQEGSLAATVSANTLALAKGAHILRVHDVKEAVDAIKVYGAYSAS